jgi:hypothetical protein
VPGKLQAGDVTGVYRVINPTGFAGTLPTAEIISGPNTGYQVILTSPFRKA